MWLIVIIDRVTAIISTWLFFVRYGSIARAGKGCSIAGGVKVTPLYWLKTGRLSVIFKGHNHVGPYSEFKGSGLIEIGERSFCGQSRIFAANDYIEIGKNVMIAEMVTIRDTNPPFMRMLSKHGFLCASIGRLAQTPIG